jgi:hypothetical protein
MINPEHPGKPHAFFCGVCGCSLYTVHEISDRECESCLGWLDRVIRRVILRRAR